MVVSGAAGAVGTVVGQIAKIKGCRAVGIAGGAEKCQYIVTSWALTPPSTTRPRMSKRRCDNIVPGGSTSTSTTLAAKFSIPCSCSSAAARIVVCGAISQYNNTTPVKGPSNYLSLLVNRASMKGFVCFDYADRYGEAAREMAGWMAAGKLKSREDMVDGFETFPETLLKLFKGENIGKLMIKLGDA